MTWLCSTCSRPAGEFHAPDCRVMPETIAGEDLAELQQSRAVIAQHEELVAKLRALAERMREYDPPAHEDPAYPDYAPGLRIASVYWLSELDSLLASHGAAQTEQK